jgi:hypothetical protein
MVSKHSMMQEQKDEKLWRIAKKRAGFQRSLVSYFIVNVLLWAIWFFTRSNYENESQFPWPVWPMLGWGIGLFFQYFEAYGGDKNNLAEKEYDKLKNKTR